MKNALTASAVAILMLLPGVTRGDVGATLKPAKPDGAIDVPAVSGALAEAIDKNGPGTTFYLAAGMHAGNGDMRPKPDTVIIGAADAILDGGGKETVCLIHDPGVIPWSQKSPRYVVTLRNLVIQNYVPADQECAVMAQDTGQGWQAVLTDAGDRNGWLIEHCTFKNNRAGGAFLGSASTARDCLAADNGQVGFKATGRRPQFINCRATGNNAARKFDYFVEAGGMKCWNVKDLLVEGGEYDRNGGAGVWLDYVWDANVIRGASFHHNLRSGIAIEMAVGVEVTGCTLGHDDVDGLAGTIPKAFRPWDESEKSGPDLWSGEISLFNGAASGTFTDPQTKQSHTFKGKTHIHRNTIREGGGGIVTLYQDRAAINPLAQMQGNTNGPVAGLDGIVVEDNDVACANGYAAAINVLPNRDYQDAAGAWGPIPAKQAQSQYGSVVYRNNRYTGVTRFSVPAAITKPQGASIWDWNGRVTVDLERWRKLNHDVAR